MYVQYISPSKYRNGYSWLPPISMSLQKIVGMLHILGDRYVTEVYR